MSPKSRRLYFAEYYRRGGKERQRNGARKRAKAYKIVLQLIKAGIVPVNALD